MGYERVEVPYEGKYLPAFVMEPTGELIDTLIVHGGFDSLAEELLHQVSDLTEDGFRVILFEGPGQGHPLKVQGIPMIPEWEKPVGAVLDHFAIKACSLLGISLGGCLATRAAAHEPRIKRVIADDVLADFYGVLTSRMFTAAESASNHCHIGNQGLAQRVMRDWLLAAIEGSGSSTR